MIRSLFIIAAASLVLAIVCLAGAAAIGGQEVTRNGWKISGDGWSLVEGDFNWESSSEDIVTREIAWEGGEVLTFDLSARVIYAQGDEPSITVAGPAGVVDRVTFADGRFDLEQGTRTGRRSRPRITIVAPAVTRFTLNGSQDLEIRDYDQPTLALAVSGSGDIEGYGRTDALTVDRRRIGRCGPQGPAVHRRGHRDQRLRRRGGRAVRPGRCDHPRLGRRGPDHPPRPAEQPGHGLGPGPSGGLTVPRGGPKPYLG